MVREGTEKIERRVREIERRVQGVGAGGDWTPPEVVHDRCYPHTDRAALQYVQKKEEKDAFSFTRPEEVRLPGSRANACARVEADTRRKQIDTQGRTDRRTCSRTDMHARAHTGFAQSPGAR